MSPIATTGTALLTAEAFADMPDDGRRLELVRGRVVEVSRAKPPHGYICANCSAIFWNYVRSVQCGRVLANDTGVITERDPDTVRGPDVSYFSYERMPRGPLPTTYPTGPELVVEVKSPSDSYPAMARKADEYLAAGTILVLVVDPETEVVAVFSANDLPRRYSNGDELTLPEVFPDFRVSVRSFFA